MPDHREADLAEAVRRAAEAAPAAPQWAEIERRLAAVDRDDPGHEPRSSRSLLIAAMIVVLAGFVGLVLVVADDGEVRLDTDPVATTTPPPEEQSLPVDDAPASFGEWTTETEPAVVQVCLAGAAARLDGLLPILPPASGPTLQGWNTDQGRAVRYLRHHQSMQDLLDLNDPSIEYFEDATWAREAAAIENVPQVAAIEPDSAESSLSDVAAARQDASVRQADPARCWTDQAEVLDQLTPLVGGGEVDRSNLRCLRAARALLVLDQLAESGEEAGWWDVAESALIEMDEDGAGPDTAAPTAAVTDARFATADERFELLEEGRRQLEQYAAGLEPSCSIDFSYP